MSNMFMQIKTFAYQYFLFQLCRYDMIKEQRLAKFALVTMRPLMKIAISEPFFSVINK